MPDLIDHFGAWEGTWLTFLRPDELHDESPLRATIDRDGSGFVINYRGSIQGDEVRVSGKKRDDLQAVIALLKGVDIDLPLQYENFRD